jgi:Putative transposase
VPYCHVVFTLPPLAAEIAFQNKRAVYAILFRAAAEAMHDIAADPKHSAQRSARSPCSTLGGKPCSTNLHCIVPGGGLSPDQTRWVACRPGFFLPVRVLSRRFRTLFLAQLQAAFVAGELHFSGTLATLAEPTAFAVRLDALRAVECRVGGDVVAPTPHRPGRADFPHPVPHERDSLAAA